MAVVPGPWGTWILSHHGHLGCRGLHTHRLVSSEWGMGPTPCLVHCDLCPVPTSYRSACPLYLYDVSPTPSRITLLRISTRACA